MSAIDLTPEISNVEDQQPAAADPAADLVAAQQEGLAPAETPHFPITDTRDVVVFLAQVGLYGATHKNFGLGDVITAGPALLAAAVKAIDGIGNVPEEIGDMDNGERLTLTTSVAQVLAPYMTPDSIADITVDCVDAALALIQIANKVKRHIAAGTTPAAAALAPIDFKKNLEQQAETK